ncbi:MAG TPA: tRNA 2-thiocytidine biosynthesis protein TtcA [Candidatus Coprovivens excrementavium]|nr:tRNA 2-thiocytidine biosynthesis protein TtcA [Candidatus Coprovivens excrementavium]
MERYREIEKSIIKKYRKEIWSKFIKAIKDYELIQENDSIMVCISGGKDSFLLAKCIQELVRHGQIPFTAHYVVMDPGYNKLNRQYIEENAKTLNIPIEIFNTDIFEVANKLNPENPCYMCARMRRGHLYNKAKELGCNKIALGHHFDDVIETTLMSMLYGAEIKTMLPKIHSDNFEGVDLIRPLYLVKEESIIAWCNYNELKFLNCACQFTARTSTEESLSKRQEMKELIKYLKTKNKDIDHNIFKSLDNINLNCVLGYHKDKKRYSFLDDYNKNK